MNITILANRDIASNFAINLLLPHFSKHKLTIFLSSKVGKNVNKPADLQRLAYFEQDLFNQFVFPQMNDITCGSTGFKSFEQLDKVLAGGVSELNNINSDDGLAVLTASAPDLIISIRYGVIIKSPVIAVPRYGVINLHSGLLPDYRGVMASFWAMLNDDKEIGTTLHYINDGTIDTGKVISKSYLEVNYQKSYLWHVLQLYKNGTAAIIKIVAQLSQNVQIESTLQQEGGDYYTFPTQQELETFINSEKMILAKEELVEFIKQYYLKDIELNEIYNLLDKYQFD